jgi:serine/arginine repetitive matrix protein 2
MRQQRKSPSQQGSMPRSSQSQSQSQTQTSSTGRSQTHSSKSGSRDHSRTDSWSKSALKVVQSAPCCDVDATRTPVVENTVPWQKEACKAPLNNDVIASNVADSTCVVGPSTLPLPVIVPSPTPSSTSRITDPRVGIAISTPLTDESLNRDNLRLLSHPYAQGGLYSSPSREQPAEYAGRHPITTATQTAQLSDCPAARQKYSPHALPSHPYAQASSSLDSYDDDLVNYVLAEKNAWKMWSPSIGENYNVTGITDTAGVGEILVYAAEQQKDGVSGAKDSDLGSAARMQSARKVDSAGKLGSHSKLPVQYDVTRQVPPLHLQKAPDTPHTFASSSLEHRITPRIPQFVKDEMAKNLPVPVGGSAESSQSNSPRPLGSPNDLVGFHDLFYKPGGGSLKHRVMQQSSSELSTNSSQYSQIQLSHIPFDLKSPNQGRASGLSTLAHKLSREYEQLSSRERASSQSGDSVAMASPRPSPIRKPTEGSLEFVFEETRPMSTGEQPNAGQGLGLSSFRHQDNIPEDVASVFTTGTDKEVEASEDETGMSLPCAFF